MRTSRVLSAQPNVLAISRSVEFSTRFWLLLLATGVGVGLAGGLLMRLLYAVQHLAWQAAPLGLYTMSGSSGRWAGARDTCWPTPERRC